MPQPPLPPALLASLHAADLAALAVLCAAWGLLGWLSEHPPRRRPSVTALMAGVRRDWMREFRHRENRIFDAQIIASLRQGSAFFASTAILAIGGVLALIGNVRPLADLAAQIGQGDAPTLMWQLRLLPAALLLTAAFLRFAWSNRVFGHASVMMAAVPEDAANPLSSIRAKRAAELLNRAALNFSRGLRAMYFALASLAWIAGPVALMLAAILLAAGLARREFASVPRDVLAEEGD